MKKSKRYFFLFLFLFCQSSEITLARSILMLVSGGHGDNSRVALSSSLFLLPFSPQSLFHLSSSSFSKFLPSRWSHLLSSLIHSPCIPLLSLPLPLPPTDRLVPFCSLGSDAPHSTQYRGVERTRRSSPFSPPIHFILIVFFI